ncbi:hypothetical protein H6503_01220 [Candidatus Woesearchaeota archaeon]|nr:hypothetical protein [Candidatus Woesearchaeota archaeon]
MYIPIIKWDIYEITTDKSIIKNVMLRGRIRKYCLQNERNILAENTSDMDNTVRFAVPEGEEVDEIIRFLKDILPDSHVAKVRDSVPNPVLSKLKVNLEDRYTLT